MESATQKSLDEESKSADNVPIESILQKPKSADEDSGQVKLDSQPSNNAKKDKLSSAEEGKEKFCSVSSSHTAQNGQNVNVQDKDIVDSVDIVTIAPQSKESEDVTPNDKANGNTHIRSI